MIQSLRDAWAKHWLRKRNIKLSHGIRTIPRQARLILEARTTVNVDTMSFDELQIGAMTYIRSGSQLRNVSEIGRFCSISNHVVIGQERGGREHNLDAVTTNPFLLETVEPENGGRTPPPTRVGHDVWIGRDAMILEGVSVGIGAVIGSRSVVTADVPPYAIVAGNPARLIRYRLPEGVIPLLLESHWWNIDLTDLSSLSLTNPVEFLADIRNRTFHRANHIRCLLTRSSWSELAARSEAQGD